MKQAVGQTLGLAKLYILFALFIYLALPTRAGSPQLHMPINVGPFTQPTLSTFPVGGNRSTLSIYTIYIKYTLSNTRVSHERGKYLKSYERIDCSQAMHVLYPEAEPET
jgi:hypothetical protein